MPFVNKQKMTAGELEVALAKIDINRHEAIDMLGSLGKPILFYRLNYINYILIDIARLLFLVSAESQSV